MTYRDYILAAYICVIPPAWVFFALRFYRVPGSPEHGSKIGAGLLGWAAGCWWLPAFPAWWLFSRPLENEGPC